MTTRVPLDGTTLIVGPSNVGKTRLTRAALGDWVDQHGTDGVVVLEFAPELHRNGRVLGGRLDRFDPIPGGVWSGVLDAHAPRAQAGDEDEAVALARDNAERAAELIAAAPTAPRAVFVNDATIPFQHEVGEVGALTEYADAAACAVLNAFESDELGTDDPVSRRERAALDALGGWADRVVRLDGDD